MSIPNAIGAHEPATPPTPWPYPGLEDLLLAGLPVGALTVVTLGALHGGFGDWPSTVARLALGTVAAGRPVTYVQAGGFEQASARSLTARASSPLFQAVSDEDIRVAGPLVASNDPSLAGFPVRQPLGYWCTVPTLVRIEAAVAQHEERHGPSLLVLDEVELARPYWQACTDQDDLALPGAFRLTQGQANAWRAEDLAVLAEQRRESPTVVVWHCTAADPHGARALIDVAHTLVRCVRRPDGPEVFFSAAERSSLCEPLDLLTHCLRTVAE